MSNVREVLEDRKNALLWAFMWGGAVLGMTGVSLWNNFHYHLGEVNLNNAFMLMVVFFMLSYLSYRRGKL